ncbi:unnamed protein product [Mycena citricolor]|uniref:Peptidase S8/S53 domain-containing protein n=1 Tax=Mycena citricolor TaxID=2018698 RepID=A0AAD2H0F3_9AGAR|nr:unnamed protein product [Mycena citricolor]
MKLPLTASLLLCAAATAAQAAKFSLADVQRVTNVAGASVGNKFIVEVSDAANIPTKRDGETAHQLLYRTLEERKISYDVHDEFNVPGIFVGASLTLTDSKDVANLLGAPGVLFIHPVRTYSRPVPVASKKASPGDAGLPDPESTHIDTGVSKLHAQGIFGKGVKIGILDTGVDYTHPFLGPGFGPGHKIAGGYDFVGDAYTGSNTPVPDPDPLDQCAGHGTHVAGIIGANPGNPFNISGVAYEASIYAYRIFGCTGVVQDPVIIQALLMGYNAGMDILTMSLGGPDGWTEGAASVVSSRISSAGRIVTIAAGNDGASGSWYTSSPGNSITSISVASSENTLLPLQTLQVTGVTHAPIVYFDSLPLPVTGTRPLYVISNDTTVVDDACNPLPASTPDLSKFVVLVRRGTCNFVRLLLLRVARWVERLMRGRRS